MIEFNKRRTEFLRKIKDGVAVLPSAPMMIRNHDVHHPYRQDSSFFYLTGFDEPNSLSLFAPASKAP